MVDSPIEEQAGGTLRTPFSQRLDVALRHLGMTNAQLASALDAVNGGQLVNGWRSRGRLSNSSRERLRRELPGISLEWLIDGVGEMLVPLVEGRLSATEEPDGARAKTISEPAATGYLRPIIGWNSPDDLPADATVFLKKLDFYLSAGHGGPDPNAVEQTDKVTPFRADFCAANGWSPQTHFTMRCQGESMEPTIQHGAPVVIATNEKTIRSGKIYALLLDGEPLLKRLDKLPGGKIRVRSDNAAPAYAAFDVDASSLEIIGRAVWTPVRL